MADIKIQDATTTTHAALDNKIPVYDGTLVPTTITPEQIINLGVAGGVVAAALGADDNYVTDAEKVKLANLDPTTLNAHLTNTNDPHQTQFDQLSGTLSKLPMNTSLPAQTLSAGEMAWNPDERCFDMGVNGVTLQAGQEFLIHVRNSTGTTINNGTVCMAVGTIGASGRITVAPMDGTNSANSMRLLGLATEDIIAGQDGFVTAIGKVRGVDTSAWSEGDVLYTSTTVIGGLTNIAPTTGLKQPIAYVVTDHASVGTLFVRIETLDHLAFEPANTNIQAHISSTSNPHSVTYSQVGAEPANANIQSHISSTSNPHSVTKTQVGLGNVLNAEQEVISAKGQALGYCPLDGSAKVAEAYLPDSVLGQVEYQGIWNATTNTPAIPAASTANKGRYYIVSVSGTTTIDGISEWTIGDWIISNGTTWNKVDNTDSVSSVFGRSGAIVANSGDYTASQVTNVPAGNIAATTVQAAINELDSEKAATSHTQAESTITFTDITTGNVSTTKHGYMPKSYPNCAVVTTSDGTVTYIGAEFGAGLPLVSQGASYPVFDKLNIASGTNVSGILAIANGGTGSSTQNFVDLSTNQTVGGVKTFSSPIIAPAGSVSAPSMSAAGDTNTGIYFPAADTVGIATAGVEKARITSAGNMLIGSNIEHPNPAKTQITSTILGFSVKADTADTARFWRPVNAVSAAAGRILFGGYVDTSTYGDYASIGAIIENSASATKAGALAFSTATAGTLTEKLRVNSAGEVLIGTSSQIIAGYQIQTNAENNGVAGTYLRNSNTGTAANTRIGLGSSNDVFQFIKYGSGYTGRANEAHIYNGAGDIYFSTNAGTERLRITQAGSILIGTPTDPGYTAKLHVAGGMSFDNVANANSRVLSYYEGSGTFTATATGMTTAPTGTVKYTRIGNQVTLDLPAISGTSNATEFTLTGGPVAIRPAGNKEMVIRVKDNTASVYTMGLVTICANGVLYLYPTVNGGTWTASGTKSIGTISVSYTLQ